MKKADEEAEERKKAEADAIAAAAAATSAQTRKTSGNTLSRQRTRARDRLRLSQQLPQHTPAVATVQQVHYYHHQHFSFSTCGSPIVLPANINVQFFMQRHQQQQQQLQQQQQRGVTVRAVAVGAATIAAVDVTTRVNVHGAAVAMGTETTTPPVFVTPPVLASAYHSPAATAPAPAASTAPTAPGGPGSLLAFDRAADSPAEAALSIAKQHDTLDEAVAAAEPQMQVQAALLPHPPRPPRRPPPGEYQFRTNDLEDFERTPFAWDAAAAQAHETLHAQLDGWGGSGDATGGGDAAARGGEHAAAERQRQQTIDELVRPLVRVRVRAKRLG